MLRRPRTKNNWLLTAGIGFSTGIASTSLIKFTGPALAQSAAIAPADVAALRAEIETLKHLLPDQAHAMSDVDYQFANRWFARQNANWLLAEFSLNETSSHLNWAVRLLPVRKLSSGAELDVAAMLRGVGNSSLAIIKNAITKQDSKLFDAGYRQAITETYGCHRAAEKPYLRPKIPQFPASHMIIMRSGAD